MSTSEHTCASSGRSGMRSVHAPREGAVGRDQRLRDLGRWRTVQAYPRQHPHRMRAVAAVARVVDQVSSWRQIDAVVVDELARGGDAAAAAACAANAELKKLRACLREVGGFLRGVARRPELGHGAVDLIEEAEAVSTRARRK